ncbi:MAG: hypothetical protein U1F87_06940 [Kiritimatiellia bacterium]
MCRRPAGRSSSRGSPPLCREHGTSLVYAIEPALADMADRRIAMAEGALA